MCSPAHPPQGFSSVNRLRTSPRSYGARAPPAIPLTIDFPADKEDAFACQQLFLSPVCRMCDGEGDSPLCIDDAVPRNGKPGRERMERIPHLPRAVDQSRQSRHLGVRGDLPARYAPNNAPYLLVLTA